MSAVHTCIQAQTYVVIEAKEPVALMGFYSSILGLAVIEQSPEGTVLAAGEIELIVIPRSSSDREADPSMRLLIPVAEIGEARARLDAAGVPYRPLLTPSGDTAALYFSDPEDNRIGLVLAGQSYDLWLTAPELADGETGGRPGKTELAVYGGFHGIWLGIAIPVAFEATSAGAYGAGLLLGGPIGAIAGYHYGKDNQITKGQARLISLLGSFGIWQGAGWAGQNDAEGRSIVLSGALGGLAGIGTAAAIAERTAISRGQAEMMVSGANWGCWYGLLAASIAEENDPETLPSMLIGSAAGLLIMGGYSAHTDIEVNRMRWINLGGVLGTVIGFGIDLLFEVDDEQTVLLIPAITGALGLTVTAARTRPTADLYRYSADDRAGSSRRSISRWGVSCEEGSGWQLPDFALGADGSARVRVLRFRF